MKHLFCKELYLQCLKRIRAAGIASAVMIILLNAIIPITTIIDTSSRYDILHQPSVSEVAYYELAPICLLCLILAPIVTFSTFSYLNERSKSDFYHALPQKRQCVFLSFTLAALTWLIATVIASCAINAVIWALSPYYAVSLLTIVLCILDYTVLIIMTVGFMSLAMTLTGTTVANFLVGLLFALFFRLLGAMFISYVESVSRVVLLSHSPLQYLGIEFFLPYGIFTDTLLWATDSFTNLPLIIYSLILGVGLVALATLCYCRRKSEMAGSGAPSRKLQNVFRIAITTPITVLLALLIITDEIEAYHLVVLVAALLVYLLYELITTKKPKNMIKVLPSFLIPLAIGGVFAASVLLTSAAIDGRQPSADEISGVALVTDSNYGDCTYEQLISKQSFIEDAQICQLVSKRLSDTVRNNFDYNQKQHYSYVSIEIRLHSGAVIGRRIRMTDEEQQSLRNAFNKVEAELGELLSLPSAQSITAVGVNCYYGKPMSDADTMMLWRCFCEEYETLSDDQKLAVKNASGNGKMNEKSAIGITINGQYKLKYYYSVYSVIPDIMPKTLQKYIEIFNRINYSDMPTATLGEFCDVITDAMLPNDNNYFYCNVDISPLSPDNESFNLSLYRDMGILGVSSFDHFKHVIIKLSECDDLTDYSNVSQIYSVTLEISGYFVYSNSEIPHNSDSYYYTFFFTLPDTLFDDIVQ